MFNEVSNYIDFQKDDIVIEENENLILKPPLEFSKAIDDGIFIIVLILYGIKDKWIYLIN